MIFYKLGTYLPTYLQNLFRLKLNRNNSNCHFGVTLLQIILSLEGQCAREVINIV